MKPVIAYGTVTGTGAAINISCGFVPDHVVVFNDTAGDNLEYFSSMAAGSAYKRVAAGTGSKITSNGISPFAGSTTAAPGFTIGTDGVNANAVTLRWMAARQP